MKKLILIVFIISSNINYSQGFLRAEEKEIVNDNGAVLLRGIGTGNWLLQEGYMMQTTATSVTTHTRFRNKLVGSMGEEKTNAFYNKWIDNHFTKKDLDSLKDWGFNSVRVALHYKWFTLPIEDESKNSDGSIQNTWLDKGFDVIDELLSWCAENEMYLILDMHGAPGGQGGDANISDYDSTKPSLWESEDNKDKLVALWVKLADRYKDSEWIGGFDLINETNWGLANCENQSGCGCTNNYDLWNLHERLIKAIRTVNNNHIVYVSGNCWGNNYEGFNTHSLKDVDDNMVITFHKYWNSNNDDSIKKWLEMREQYNLPLWMSEGGENSNAWFADCISLLEKSNIGWSWWPVKKSRVNNVLKVKTGDKYLKLMNAWGNYQVLSEEETFEAVMEYAESHKIENCTVAKDVIYAMIEQPGNTNTKPFKEHSLNDKILFADFDLGNDGFAYHDIVSANYHISEGGNRAIWNDGGYYRNDGVDISEDNETPYVGWTDDNEWLLYTIYVEEAGDYKFEIISAAKDNGGTLSIEINDTKILENIELPKTSNWTAWEKKVTPSFYLPKGKQKIKMIVEKSGSNLLEFYIINKSSVLNDNFGIKTQGETCENKNDGIVSINAIEENNYKLHFNGEILNFNSTIEISDVPPGSYELCILVDEINFEQCYKVEIPKSEVIAGKWDIKNKELNISINKGTPPFNVFKNNKKLSKIDGAKISLDVVQGDIIEIQSSKQCEGKFIINIDFQFEISIFPNPTTNELYIASESFEEETLINIYDTQGKVIISGVYFAENGLIKLSLEKSPPGVYLASIGDDKITASFRVIKL